VALLQEMEGEACYSPQPVANVAIASFLIAGITISYIPQYVSIIRTKSSEGLNFVTLGLAMASSLLLAINSGILKWPKARCCWETPLTAGQCLENNLATLQIFSGSLALTILYILYLLYFENTPTNLHTHSDRVRMYRQSLALFCAIWILCIFFSTLGGILYYNVGVNGEHIWTFARVLGGVSGVITIVTWTPQIYTTWKLRDSGALSVLMLLLQFPGSLLIIFFQGVLEKASITTWGPYLLGAIQQLVLIIMCIVFRIKGRKRYFGPETKNNTSDRTPLLHNLNSKSNTTTFIFEVMEINGSGETEKDKYQTVERTVRFRRAASINLNTLRERLAMNIMPGDLLSILDTETDQWTLLTSDQQLNLIHNNSTLRLQRKGV